LYRTPLISFGQVCPRSGEIDLKCLCEKDHIEERNERCDTPE